MKILILPLLLLYTLESRGQDPSKTFRLTFTTFNHADRFFDGTTTCILTESSLKVTKTYLLDTVSKTVYSRRIKNSQSLIANITNIRLDTLNDFYFNACVMATSGNEYFLDYSSSSTIKHINVHHYYLKPLGDLIQILNSDVPKKYQFRYLTTNTKQNCRL